MKRKLSSLGKERGIQSITKFFKSLTPQGPKRSCALLDDSVSMKTTKEDEIRMPIFEKLQAEKESLISNVNCPRMSPDNRAEMDREKSLNSESKALQSSAGLSVRKHKMPSHSPVMDNEQHSASEENQTELSSMDCDETFFSAHEDSDTLYDTCCESFNSKSCNESVIANAGNEEEGDLNRSERKEDQETDLHGDINVESISEDSPMERNSCCDDLKEVTHDCDGVKEGDLNDEIKEFFKPSMISLSKEEDSPGYIHEEVKANSLINKDQNNVCNDLMEGEDTFGFDNCKEEDCNKDSDQVTRAFLNVVKEFHPSDERKDSECVKGVDNYKEGVDGEDCEDIDEPFSDIHIDRDSNDDGISEGSDSSDEDLLTPPVFLSEKMKLKPDVRTPEKGVAPAYSTPSPVVRDAEKEDKIKYKLSFDKLIKEKVKKREKDAELAEMEAELQRGLEKGGISHMHVPSTFSDIESEEELMDDGRDLKDCTLPKDIKKFLVDVHDFSEELPGEDIFPMFTPYVTSQDFPCLLMPRRPESDTFEGKMLTASDVDLQELLCGGWILQHYLDRACPPEVSDWLFQIMCRHSDQHIIRSAFEVLWAMIEAATENRDDLPQTQRGSLWVPSIKKIIRELLSFGATVPRLFPGHLLGQLSIKEILSDEICSGEIHLEDVKANSSHQSECFPVVNMMHLVQFLTHCLQKCHSFTVQDLKNLVVLLCRLVLDVRLQTVVFDIEMCLAAVLNCYGESQWSDEMKELCSIVAKLSTDHRNLLHLVQIQPPSVKGIQFQRVLSMTLLQWLVLKFCKQEEPGKSLDSQRCEASVPDSVEVSDLVKLVERLKPGEESDYFLLHTIISLLNLAVGSEDLLPKERGSLEKLTNKLRTLNGDIKDPRAAFMNRTKVKDLLVRTILRLAYMTQCIKPSRELHINSYFECSSSDYEVELLKETRNENEEERSDEEESTTAQMDYTTSNYM